MKITLFLSISLLTVLSFHSYSQTKTHTVYIHGHVLNNKEPFVEVAVSGFFHQFPTSIPIEKDGSFRANLPTDSIQDIFMDVAGGMMLFAQPGDTIDLHWDASDAKNTFTVSSPNKDYSAGLQLCAARSKKYVPLFIQLSQRLNNEAKAPDSLKFSWINRLYNDEINDALADTNHLPSSIHKLLNDVYYQYATLLYWQKLLDKFELTTEYPVHSVSSLQAVRPSFKGVFPSTKTLNKEIFLISETYRNFIFTYVRSKSFAAGNDFTLILSADPADNPHFTFMWKDYYTILCDMPSYPIRDWLVTKAIMQGVEHQPFDEVEAVYKDFLTKCTVKAYRDTLANFFNVVKGLRPGNPAPGFTLKDTSGRPVSLHDLKGKIVYIDFWGLNCGPCMYDIKNYVPELHKRYAGKDVVFVNICVCGGMTEPGWKQRIIDLGLDGINLLAPKWTSNPVCQAYDAMAVPHYVLIDREGKMISGNGPMPYLLVKNNIENEIDKALGK